MTQPKDPYTNQGDGRDTPARQKLVSLRQALLRLHKTLLDMERRDYEKIHGVVKAGELFRLVVGDPQFAWLHNISEFVVRIDEALSVTRGFLMPRRTSRSPWPANFSRQRNPATAFKSSITMPSSVIPPW